MAYVNLSGLTLFSVNDSAEKIAEKLVQSVHDDETLEYFPMFIGVAASECASLDGVSSKYFLIYSVEQFRGDSKIRVACARVPLHVHKGMNFTTVERDRMNRNSNVASGLTLSSALAFARANVQNAYLAELKKASEENAAWKAKHEQWLRNLKL